MAIDRDLIAKEAAIGMYDRQPAEEQRRGFSVITAFPLLVIPFLVYNILALFSLGGSDGAAYNAVTQILFNLPMPSPGTHWAVSVGDVILFGALICLFFE